MLLIAEITISNFGMHYFHNYFMIYEIIIDININERLSEKVKVVKNNKIYVT